MAQKQKIKQRPLWLFLLVLCLVLGMALPVSAALDVNRPCSLSLAYTGDGQPFAGQSVSVYRVAEMLPDGSFQKIAPFTQYPVSIHDVTSQSGWLQVADTFVGYVVADAIVPTATVATNEEGKAEFANLPSGMYLVEDVTVNKDNVTWDFGAFMLYMPMQEDGVYTYDVVAKPKVSRTEDTPDGTQYKLLKVWKDRGHTAVRPTSITVKIAKNKKPWKTVTLSKENNWSYSWTDEDSTATWSVSEQIETDTYTVLCDKKGATFELINTWSGPGTPDTPDEPEPPKTGDTEPLWLYVLMMVFSGIALVLVGVGSMRGQKDGKTK